MNTSVDGIIVNNCQYAPIYLIQDPGATQAFTYVLTPTTIDQPKPCVSNNLKTFYENSGNIENGLVNVDAAARPSTVKKEGVLIGNNLKLASFLLPKKENVNKQYVVDNLILKPNITTTVSTPIPVNTLPVNTVPVNTVPVTTVPVNTVPKIDMDRKIVKLKEVPIINRRPEKLLPKIKPKENTSTPSQSKHTSVQLIKLGETYHSLNHLSKDQIKMVNQALKMFKDPDKSTPEPTYDPVTNTKYIYKIVSPKDLQQVVGQKKYVVKDKKLTKISKKVVEEKLKLMKQQAMQVKEKEPEEPDLPVPTETKVTRSGRKVKLPKQILPEDSPQKSKKKSGTTISCFQCSAEFGSLYRLQKHYENHPTHIPAKIHSNLFHCLLAIIKGGSEGDKTNIFIQQLEQLIVKLKSLLPCLLKKVDGSCGQSCTINDDIGRLFNMNPGKYKIDVDALNCVKDKDGYCIHNPPKLNQYSTDIPATLSKLNEEMANPDNEYENCARINSVAKWPTVSKRNWKLKQKTHPLSAKKMRLKSESDTLIDLGTDDLMFNTEQNNPDSSAPMVPQDDVAKLLENNQDCTVNHTVNNSESNNITMAEPTKSKNTYTQFHSAHFDIRSSPIKPSSTVFRKFQINPSKMSNYQVQVIRSLEMVDKDKHTTIQSPNNDLHIPMSDSDDNLHVTLPNSDNAVHLSLPDTRNGLHASLSNSDNVCRPSSDNLHVTLPRNELHVALPDSDDSLHATLPSSNGLLPNSENSLHVPLSTTDNSLDISLPATENSLHDIFKNDVDLSCKEDSNIDPELKDWIISTSEKSHSSLQSFTKSSGLIEPAFLHGRDSVDKTEKNVNHNGDMPSLDGTDTDNRLLSNQGESVLNFLETLGNDLVYPETEIRNSGVDFQLDLFAFHNS